MFDTVVASRPGIWESESRASGRFGMAMSPADFTHFYIHDEMSSTSNTSGLQRTEPGTFPVRSDNRRWSAISNAEEGEDVAAEEVQQAISEEIDEIKRYEVYLESRLAYQLELRANFLLRTSRP